MSDLELLELKHKLENLAFTIDWYLQNKDAKKSDLQKNCKKDI